MHVHILGISGTFMSGVALIAKQLGYSVSGSDSQFYPPIGPILKQQDITLFDNYHPDQLDTVHADVHLIGNALSRGSAIVEKILNERKTFQSAPAWLAETVLKKYTVIAVAGTHGKTTITSMISWMLEYAKLKPSFLIGGVPNNFGYSARVAQGQYFVIEADEYDTAFFDKRAKFIHYQPQLLVISNLEYDHADIYSSIEMIQRELHHLIRTIPGNGFISYAAKQPKLDEALDKGCWTPKASVGGHDDKWQVECVTEDYSIFHVRFAGEKTATISWELCGKHNAENALFVFAIGEQIGIAPQTIAEALSSFRGVKKRLEKTYFYKGLTLYHDFAHHPTAVQASLQAVRPNASHGHLVAVFEPRSNSLKKGLWHEELIKALMIADRIYLYLPETSPWKEKNLPSYFRERAQCFNDYVQLEKKLKAELNAPDQIVIMSNGDFNKIAEKLSKHFEQKQKT